MKLASLIVLLSAVPLAARAADPAPAAVKPNVLFILVDDFGGRDLACYGSALYETPHMDRLAAGGVRFTAARSSYPRCVPSRFAMLTGKYPARFQGVSDGLHIQPGRDRTFGQAFQAAGYRTFYCGKWHLGDGASAPAKNGFDQSFAAGAAGAARSHFAPYNTPKRPGGGQEKDPLPDVDNAPAGEYLTDRLTDETCRWIRSNGDRPFLAVLAHYAVHTPIEGKPEFANRYRGKLKGMNLPSEVWEKESAGENLTVQNNPVYAAMIQSADESVGKLLALLDELKIADRTIVVLTSDHGGLSARGNQREVATSNRPFRAGKGHLYDGGLRVPLIVRWPGSVKAGSVFAEPVTGTDLFPSLLEMAGLPRGPEQPADGRSWASAVRSGAPGPGRPLFWHNPAPRPVQTADWFSSAILDGNLKLLEFPEYNRVELYDLANDTGEAKNLATEQPENAKRLLDQLHRWQRETGAAAPGSKKN